MRILAIIIICHAMVATPPEGEGPRKQIIRHIHFWIF